MAYKERAYVDDILGFWVKYSTYDNERIRSLLGGGTFAGEKGAEMLSRFGYKQLMHYAEKAMRENAKKSH